MANTATPAIGPQYFGSKTLYATPKTLGEYNKHRGWTIPENEDPNREGYMVQYEGDGYISWSPKEIFEAAYRRTDELTFGQAIEAAKAGKKVARSGWNGQNVYAYIVSAQSFKSIHPASIKEFGEGNNIAIYTA